MLKNGSIIVKLLSIFVPMGILVVALLVFSGVEQNATLNKAKPYMMKRLEKPPRH